MLLVYEDVSKSNN